MTVISKPIEIKVAGHTLRFKTMSWRDTMRFRKEFSQTKRDILKFSLTHVGDLEVDFKASVKIIDALSDPIVARLFTIYMGSYPDKKKFYSVRLWSAPEATDYNRKIEEDIQTKEDATEKMLEEKFGREALNEEQELYHRMMAGTRYKDAKKAEQKFYENLTQSKDVEE